MDSIELSSLDDSLDDFEFLDAEGDLDISFRSSVNGAGEKVTSGFGLIISTLTTIVEERGLVASVPVATIASTAVGAITGSLIGGAPGLAVGLMTAAVMAYRTSPNRIKSPKAKQSGKSSIRQILSQMTLQQKKELLKELLGCLKQSNVRSLILEILKNESIRGLALEILSGFLLRKMGISLVSAK